MKLFLHAKNSDEGQETLWNVFGLVLYSYCLLFEEIKGIPVNWATLGLEYFAPGKCLVRICEVSHN
jgi:hypothetical protein